MIQAVIPATQYLVTLKRKGSPHTRLVAAFSDPGDAHDCAGSTRVLMAVLHPGEEWEVGRSTLNPVQ